MIKNYWLSATARQWPVANVIQIAENGQPGVGGAVVGGVAGGVLGNQA